MMILNLLVFFTSLSLITSFHLRSPHPPSFYASPSHLDPGIPLFLSPMIYSGQFGLGTYFVYFVGVLFIFIFIAIYLY